MHDVVMPLMHVADIVLLNATDTLVAPEVPPPPSPWCRRGGEASGRPWRGGGRWSVASGEVNDGHIHTGGGFTPPPKVRRHPNPTPWGDPTSFLSPRLDTGGIRPPFRGRGGGTYLASTYIAPMAPTCTCGHPAFFFAPPPPQDEGGWTGKGWR